MLPFDSSTPTRKSRAKSNRLWEASGMTYRASLITERMLHWVPTYSSVYTGKDDDSGAYAPNANDIEFDGRPWSIGFDIYTTPYLA